MKDLFYVDGLRNCQKTWADLLSDLRSTTSFSGICQESDPYLVFRQIILSLLLDQPIVLLDADFSQGEIERLRGDTHSFEESKPITLDLCNLSDKAGLLDGVRQTRSFWSLTLYTSGTTGLPKRVGHTFASLTREVKRTEEAQNHIWGYAYNPTHMAGVQVFFQALLNGNPIVQLFGQSKERILSEIEVNRVSHISATPTFFRLLLPIPKILPHVERLTSGGEKFDSRTFEHLRSSFPNARITNVYASTEAGAILATDGDYFKIKPELEGKVKIQDNELYVHRSLMGIVDAQTSEWYATGDEVQIVDGEKPMRFVFTCRKNEMINVGGYKVNPQEVEEVLRAQPGVREARIRAKSSSVLGSILIAEVVATDPQITEVILRAALSKQLQEFKVPRLISFVDSITTTRTGKILRN